MRTKRFVIGMIVVVMALTMVLGTAWAIKTDGGEKLTGKHYNLNIIGMTKGKNVPEGDTPGQGHRIFVQMSKTGRMQTKIMLQEGDDFAVIDYDGTDGTAKFQLPNPDPGNTGTTVYSVYIRLRGKPDGDIIMTTCAWDAVAGEEICSDFQVIEVRETGHGKNKFSNVSKELLYIYAWVWNGTEYEYVRLPLFDNRLEGYFWDYDNNGVRLVQLRFYEGVQTRVPDVLKSIDPVEGVQATGVIIPVTITAYPPAQYPEPVDLNFQSGDPPVVDFGDKINVSNIIATGANTITCDIEILSNATAGQRWVTVTHETNDAELIIPFTVLEP